ncbi:hypothetical protein SMACR_07937 [Sordaria macrospora]|uniref:WGS project CABT00000000 data, contig 2.29 n=2 Tax=Sordaria macrospora TaxID=5147 RepID=F7W551_SORMK|nr:uncharacterized protein SMAC_07937 [Sordaria macrospora k-hell]KAA8628116.1 hypothetical protein SMACR_07937 [Sordaria macrospora]WPJ67132.1 hypothetical protein SMAC4_07937 [Sordaria macrospora]CCC12639.1 unnamed protein product [Sordaria macrospora k-hell]
MAVKSFSRFLFGIVAVCLWAGHMLEAQAAPEPITDSLIRRQSADDKLVFAYFMVFISFDFNWWHANTQAADVGHKIAQYACLPAQLKINGRVFASSFIGNGLDVAQMRAAAGVDVFWAPNFNPSQTPNNGTLDSAFNWMAWPNNGANKAPPTRT